MDWLIFILMLLGFIGFLGLIAWGFSYLLCRVFKFKSKKLSFVLISLTFLVGFLYTIQVYIKRGIRSRMKTHDPGDINSDEQLKVVESLNAEGKISYEIYSKAKANIEEMRK